jgi:hypothetical protein
MPGGDRTGPWGAGPRTGRSAGYCAGYGMPGYANPVGGRGLGRGWGFGYGPGFGRGGYGRGWRHRYLATGIPGRMMDFGYPPAYAYPGYEGGDERSFLMQQAEYFKAALDDINKRLDKLQETKEAKQQS